MDTHDGAPSAPLLRSFGGPAPVYIAGPYGDPDPAIVALNVRRAVLLGRFAFGLGLAPLVIHPLIIAIAGDDTDPAIRERGIAWSLALLDGIARHTEGVLFVISRDDGALSAGTRTEVLRWRSARGLAEVADGDAGISRGTWAQWSRALVPILGREAATDLA